jgi:hypothetical protein
LFDRLDVDEETGLYPCADRSQVDPEDCNGEGSGDEETENCGELCTATEKEDRILCGRTLMPWRQRLGLG